MYNYYPTNQQQPRFQMPVMGLKGRPVASLDEARAAAIDFDGSIFFFPDLANKKIYTKQINLDGTMSLNIYEMTVIQPKADGNYVTREEFEAAIASLKGAVGAQPITNTTPISGEPPAANHNINF